MTSAPSININRAESQRSGNSLKEREESRGRGRKRPPDTARRKKSCWQTTSKLYQLHEHTFSKGYNARVESSHPAESPLPTPYLETKETGGKRGRCTNRSHFICGKSDPISKPECCADKSSGSLDRNPGDRNGRHGRVVVDREKKPKGLCPPPREKKRALLIALKRQSARPKSGGVVKGN